MMLLRTAAFSALEDETCYFVILRLDFPEKLVYTPASFCLRRAAGFWGYHVKEG
jgi:hypothetical protein